MRTWHGMATRAARACRVFRTLTVFLIAGLLAVVLVPAARADGERILIWAEPAVAPLVEAQLAGGFKGATVTVVPKELKAIKDELKVVAPADAPDIVWADSAWTGELVAAGLIQRVPMAASLKGSFPKNVLSGFAYGFGYYGIPVLSENVALVTNATLVPDNPKDFTALAKAAKQLVASGKAEVGIAVGQSETGGAYFLNPLFSGLGGYVFGKNAAGSLDPYSVGIANPTFLANAGKIDKWNSQGLLKSSMDLNAAQTAFVSGRAPFWLTGQWSRAVLTGLTFKYRISAVPAIVNGTPTSPFLGIRGFMVTGFAEQHGVTALALGIVRKRLADPAFQSRVAALNGRVPANVKGTIDATTLPGRIAQAFAVAGKDGIAMPNIPQAASTWIPMGRAWVQSTRGAGATPARTAFPEAQTAVVAAIG